MEGLAAAFTAVKHDSIAHDYQLRVTKLGQDTAKDVGESMLKIMNEMPKGHVSASKVDTYA
ncbi:hypothetical protein [Desulfurispira natronophila]|uniref:Motility protein n=1 Tax=Desulfurispira natronophila TaxID=682562 RepID=A0A7W7Y4N7_9BACT|nr:hypothetical protein [Desulfurispira natronophila]MBB5021732.1 hypothetical protein [Desulfurispira natronophila]